MTAPRPRDDDVAEPAVVDGLLITTDDGGQQTPFVPSDNTTASSIIDGLARRGFSGQFIPQAGGDLRCAACTNSFAASDYRVASLRRLEGASDPDDMAAVVAAICPGCGQAGAVILGFGPTAAAVDADVLSMLSSADETRTSGGGPSIRRQTLGPPAHRRP